jgi:Mn-dependent transcriptional regulator
LGGNLKNISNGAIAKKANVSNASVSERTKHLSEIGLLTYTKYHGTHLTAKGIKLVTPIIQQQRLMETWLLVKLDIPIESIHEKANRMTESIDPMLIKHLNKYLNYPKYCPHGNAIPNNCPESSIVLYPKLSTQEVSRDTYSIKYFSEDDNILKTLNDINIHLDDNLQILNKDNDSILILNLKNDLQQILPLKIADAIMVAPS